jgi:hypothetical protein
MAMMLAGVLLLIYLKKRRAPSRGR